jgi:N-acetylglucosamine kinase-like BadF-type ATPase
MAGRRFVIGIDGGGTKTTALLVALDGTVMAESVGGPANLLVAGMDSTVETLHILIYECCHKVGCPPEAIQSIVLGLAGAGRATDRAELTDKLFAAGNKKRFPVKNITIETDAKIALEAAFAGGPGIVVISGTGSIALYRTEDRQDLRVGGWGRILGDEGSGYSIARDALNAVMRQYDGRGEKTILTQKALEHFSCSSVEEIIQRIYYQSAAIESFTPKVFEAVASHDNVAHKVILENASELAEHVRVLVMKVPPKRKLPVSLMGGVVETDNPYSKMLAERIRGTLPQVVIQKPKFPAAYGAVIIGLNAFR